MPWAVEKQEKLDMGREGAVYVMVIMNCSFRFHAALSAREAIAAAAATGRRGASWAFRCIDKISGERWHSAFWAGSGLEPSPSGISCGSRKLISVVPLLCLM